ncbi:SWI/SNF complex component SNF12-like protein [Drosera capensis]
MNPNGNNGAASSMSPGFSLGMNANSQAQAVSRSQNENQGGSQLANRAHVQANQGQTVSRSQASHVPFQVQQQGQGQSRVHPGSQGSGQVGVVSSPPAPTPGSGSSGSVKRPSQRPGSKLQASSNANTGSLLKTVELAPAARRKKRKISEKVIPDRIAALLPESELYIQLLEYEARVDAALARKKLDILDYMKNPPYYQEKLRVFVFNTFANQMKMSSENVNTEAPSWTLKIMGKILDDSTSSTSSGVVHRSHLSHPKFSSFFKRITIYLDKNLYPENHVISWENSSSATLHEGFEVKRKGDKEFTATIRLELNCVPEKFKLSTTLSQVLGIEVETRAKVVTALWHYVKFKRLQDPNDPSVFICDPLLRKLFGEEKIKFTAASQKLSQHLFPLQPLQFEHRVKLSGSNPSGNTCYDVVIDVPLPLQQEMSSFLTSMEKCQDIDAYDDTIAAAVKKIHEHHRRRAFFLGFSHSPAEFVNTLAASQSKDLKVVAGDAIRDAEKEGRSEFFNQSWVKDAVVQYLNRKTAAGTDTSKTT